MRKIGLFVIALALLLSLGSSVLAQAIQNVELHGYMQNRFYAPPSASARFVVDRLSLSASAKLGEDGQAYAEVYYHPWLTDQVVPGTYGGSVTTGEFRTYVESAYVDLPVGPGRLRLGKGRQLNFGMTPSYPNRKTSQYGIIAETFTQDRIVGAQFDVKRDMWDGGVTLYTDQSVGRRNIGEFAGALPTDMVPHLVDKDVPGAISGKLAVAGRFGVNTPCFKIHASGATGGLNRNQIGFIASTFGLFSTTDTSHSKYGLDATYSSGPFLAQAEWYTGEFSFVGISGYQVLVGYQPKDGRRAYARWSALNNDWAPTTNAASWNTQQFTLGIVQPIRKGVWAELNWEKNMESPPAGTSSIDNDLLFLEIFTGF